MLVKIKYIIVDHTDLENPLPTLNDLMTQTFGEDDEDIENGDVVDDDDDDDSSSENDNGDDSDLDVTISEALHRAYLQNKGVFSPKGKTKSLCFLV